MSEVAKAARERAIEALTNAATLAGAKLETVGAAAKRKRVRAFIEEGVDELLVAAKEAER